MVADNHAAVADNQTAMGSPDYRSSVDKQALKIEEIYVEYQARCLPDNISLLASREDQSR